MTTIAPNLIAVTQPHTMNIEVPKGLEFYLRDLLANHVVFSYDDTERNGLALIGAQVDTDSNELDIQTKLIADEIPFFLEILGDEEIAYLYGNYFDSEYRHKAVEPDDFVVEIGEVRNWHEKGTLEENLDQLDARVAAWQFTQEDIDQSGRLQLIHIVKPQGWVAE